MSSAVGQIVDFLGTLQNEWARAQAFTYGELQREMDMINRAYIEVMTEGDAKGRVFTFPIPSFNISDDFIRDSENADLLFGMTAKVAKLAGRDGSGKCLRQSRCLRSSPGSWLPRCAGTKLATNIGEEGTDCGNHQPFCSLFYCHC